MSAEIISSILSKIRNSENGVVVSDMARHGVEYDLNYGMSIVQLRNIAKIYPRNQAVALKLWDGTWREAMIMASLLAEPKKISQDTLEHWITSSQTNEMLEQLALNLLIYLPNNYSLANTWLESSNINLQVAGMLCIAHLAIREKDDRPLDFLGVLHTIKRHASTATEKNRRAIALALRRIGRINLALNQEATAIAQALKQAESPLMQWIAEDALVELSDEYIVAALR